MIEFFNKLFGREASSSTAKERLRLVLMSDHLSLAPDMVEAMKRDLVDVISKYVQVDRTKIEVSFEQQDKALAMLANIPIVGVNRDAGGPRGGSGNGAPAASPAPTANPSAQASAPENPAPPQPAVPTPRRRRRKKANPAAAT